MRYAIALLLSFAFIAPAHSQQAAPNKIQAAMEIIGSEFKAIAKQSADPAVLAGLVVKAQTIRAQILSVVGETPAELAASVPADQLPAARLGYEKLMLVLAAQAVDLEGALRKGDVGAVKAALEAMNDTKADGHDQFKP